MMNTQSMLGNNIDGEGMPGMAQAEPQLGQGMAPPQEQVDPSTQAGNYLDYALSSTNLAKKLVGKEDKEGNVILDKMAAELLAGYKSDEQSREGWMEKNKEWLKLATLIRENKTFPWPGASNIKYPLIATAAMQFSARAYPALVPQDGNVVKTRVVRKDMQGLFQEKAIRVALHMSYQVMYKIPSWEEEMDKLLMTMAVSGLCFKKTYYDAVEGQIRSSIVWPEHFCINYYAKSLETAYRKTEILEYTENQIKERVLDDEIFLDIDYGDPPKKTPIKEPITIGNTAPSETDASTPHRFLSIHTFWDLDDDGYEEPYIVTIHEPTEKVVRILARWDSDGVKTNAKGKILHIKPVEYFTAFPFIPNADGSIYACGFGMLLAPLNESVNTLINQLVDGGTLNNLSGGFISKTLRIKMGQMQVRPGQWQVVNAMPEDLKNGFFPIPSKEPSAVLMNLLQMLVQSGNQLASIAEIFVGKMPGQNTPATTTQETVQQSMAVFTAIYKRVYRSLQEEFRKIFRLNRIVPGILDEENKLLDQPINVSDYDGTEDFIIPGADPAGDSSAMRQSKLQAMGQMLQMGTIDPMAYTVRVLEAMEIPNYQELIAKPQPPQPDPKAQEMQMKMQIEQQKAQTAQQKGQMDMQLAQQKMQLEEQMAKLDAEMKQAEIEFEKTMQALKMQGEQQKMHMDQVKMVSKQRMDEQKMQHDMQAQQIQTKMDLQTQNIQNQQSVRHAEDQHQMAMKQTKESGGVKLDQMKQQGKVKQEMMKKNVGKPKPNSNKPR